MGTKKCILDLSEAEYDWIKLCVKEVSEQMGNGSVDTFNFNSHCIYYHENEKDEMENDSEILKKILLEKFK